MITREQVDLQEERLMQVIPDLSKHLAPLAERGLGLDVGRYSYGTPMVYYQGDPNRKLSIGKFVSIGPDVKIFCGRQGSHPLDLLSTFPMSMLYPGYAGGNPDNVSRVLMKSLDVEIGNDVWIGANSVILAGVTIGHGAVVAAGAVVSSSVEPYTVVGGVPAKPIKLRFDQSAIDRLLQLAWWDLPIEHLINNLQSAFFESDPEKFIRILERLRSTGE